MSQAASAPSWYEQRLKLLVEASSRLLASLDVPDVLASILDLSPSIIAAEAYSIWRLSGEQWRPVIAKGLSQTYLERTVRSTAGAGDITEARMLFEDVEVDARLASRREFYRAEGIKAMLALPLRIHGSTTGTLVFYYRQPHKFLEIELDLAEALANLAGSAITTAELYAEQRHLTRAADEGQRRASFLAEASQILASSLDYETTLATVAQLAVGRIADWCTVDVIERGHVPRRLVVSHVDPAKVAWAEELRKRYPPDENSGPQRVMRTGQAELVSRIEEHHLLQAARDPEHLAILRELAPVSYLCVPMIARNTILGALTFLNSGRSRSYQESDLALAEELAARCALAVDNALLYTEARQNEQSAREAQHEVLAREHRFRALLENSADGIVLAHRDGTIAAVIHPILGYGRDEVTGANVFSLVHPEDRGRLQTEVTTVLQNPADALWGQYRVRDQSGNWRWIEAVIKNLLADPDIQAVVVTYRDITERKRGETALRNANAELRRLNEDLHQFAYSASHDLQEPLRNLAIASELVQRKLGPDADEETRGFLHSIINNSSRMQNLLRDLLAYTQITAATPGASETDVNTALHAALESLRAALAESGAQIEVPDPLPTVAASEVHVHQILQNLIGNALKYRDPARPPRVRIEAVRQGAHWVFSVRDNGIGIDRDYHTQILGIFKRLHGSGQYTGTGIGLAIVQRVVERYGGRVWVESEVGQGATFFFTLPGHRVKEQTESDGGVSGL